MASAENNFTPLNGANLGQRLMKKWTNEKLITASISSIPRFSEEIMAKDLEKMKLWNNVTGLSVSGNRRIMELEMDDIQTARVLLDRGLFTHGRTLQFREATTDRVTVSLLGVPLGFPDLDIKDTLYTYGDIDRLYRLTKTIHGRTLPTGTVIVKFTKLDEPIPKNIDIADRRIRTIYTGQETQLARWQQLKAQQNAADETAGRQDGDTTEAHTTDSTPTNDERQQTERQTDPLVPETAEVPNDNGTTEPSKADMDMETTTTTTRKRTKEQAHISDTEQPGPKCIQPLVKRATEVESVVSKEAFYNIDDKITSPPEGNESDEDEDEFLTTIKHSLKPGSASFADIVNFIRSNARGYDSVKNICVVLTNLKIPEEIDDFIAMFMYKGNGPFSRKKIGKNKDIPLHVVDKWQKISNMANKEIERLTKTYTLLIQSEWKTFR